MTPLSADMNWLFDNYLDILAELGYIFQLESLLSIQGAEKHMLQDAVAAIESLNHVEICIVDSGKLEDSSINSSATQAAPEAASQAAAQADQPKKNDSSKPRGGSHRSNRAGKRGRPSTFQTMIDAGAAKHARSATISIVCASGRNRQNSDFRSGPLMSLIGWRQRPLSSMQLYPCKEAQTMRMKI